jgi:hypothetical protein
MTPREYWSAYVERIGSAAGVADRLDIPYPTIAAVTNGSRGVSRKLADRMVKADPSLDASVLVWISATGSPDADVPALPIVPVLTPIGAGRYVAMGTPDQIRKLLDELQD